MTALLRSACRAGRCPDAGIGGCRIQVRPGRLFVGCVRRRIYRHLANLHKEWR